MIPSCSPGFADVFRYHNHVLSLMGSCSTARAKSVASGGHPERPPRLACVGERGFLHRSTVEKWAEISETDTKWCEIDQSR